MLTLLKKTPKVLTDIVLILILAGAAGFTVNYFSDNGIQMNEKNEKPNSDLYISKEHAIKAFKQNKAVFVDARYEKYFNQSHIKGALNIPADQMDDKAIDFLNSYPDKNQLFIVYCDGEECDLSLKVKNFLNELGYNNLKILINGWGVWQKNNYPTDKN
jgi:rhodanese-related sulfurtransferase